MIVKLSQHWKTYNYGALVISVMGECTGISRLQEYVSDGNLRSAGLKEFLLLQKTCFSLVIQHAGNIYVAMDRICSHPIFYSDEALYDSITVPISSSPPNTNALTLYLMSGYLTGSETLSKSIKKLQAGETLEYSDNQIYIDTYYTYYPRAITDISLEDGIEKLHYTLDSAFKRVIEKANGRQIIVPLSGGLDSRLVLSKLLEKKYDNLFVYTYGVKGSHEAKMAEHVCNKLNIKWNYVPFSTEHIYSSEFQTLVSKYLSYMPLTSASASFLELSGFFTITSQNQTESDAMVVNGQTGDFITGGHLRLDKIKSRTFEAIFGYILEKHFSLWACLHNKETELSIFENLHDDVEFISSLYGEVDPYAFYEYWECKERQSKWVVNGQRLYDSLGLDWALPFWDADMMDFWCDAPLSHKLDQKLYVSYLKKHNYKGIFDILRYAPDPWSSSNKWIKIMAQVIGGISNRKTKNKYYKYMDFYSTYSDQYHVFGRKLFQKYWKHIRGPISLGTLISLDTLDLKEQAMKIIDAAVTCELIS
jgi:asparagine synthase (glutamine-hydrolysing)